MKGILGFGLLGCFKNHFESLPLLFLTAPDLAFSVSIIGADS